MNVCKACNTQNTDDSKFCKACGFALPIAEAAKQLVKPEEVDQLLAEGYSLVNEGRNDEALFLVEALLQASPDSTSALALKARVHEAMGDLGEAIAAYEQVVLLNPESTLDRIRLSQLRHKADAEPTPEDLEVRSRNWVAIFSGVAAAIVVVAVGIGLAISSSRPAVAQGTPDPNAPEGFATQPNQPATGNPGGVTPQLPTDGLVAQTPGNDFVGNMGSGGSSSGGGSIGNPLAGPGISPPASTGGGYEWTPDPTFGSGNSGGSALPPAGGSPIEPSGGTATTSGRNTDEPAVETPRPRDPVIKISEHRPSGGSGSTEGVSQNIYRVARNKMEQGDYRGAIRDFQAALGAGYSPAQIHQFMGLCYRRLGENGTARNHYQQAANLFEAAGNTSAAESCRQAIRSLG
jgi:Tfp pilus assembly protein PilF